LKTILITAAPVFLTGLAFAARLTALNLLSRQANPDRVAVHGIYKDPIRYDPRHILISLSALQSSVVSIFFSLEGSSRKSVVHPQEAALLAVLRMPRSLAGG
jgi:hypothetical protein